MNVRAALDRDGFAIVPLADAWSMTPEALRDASAAPFAFASRLFDEEPLFVERQPIRPIEGGRSFASTPIETPLHTDSQMILGIPATVQVLICVRQADAGGESVLVDGAKLVARLIEERRPLASALVDVDRTQRFYFGAVHGPTIARRGGHLA